MDDNTVSADIAMTVRGLQVHCRLTPTPKLQLVATVKTECKLTLHIFIINDTNVESYNQSTGSVYVCTVTCAHHLVNAISVFKDLFIV